jgi:hypothetical protein
VTGMDRNCEEVGLVLGLFVLSCYFILMPPPKTALTGEGVFDRLDAI